MLPLFLVYFILLLLSPYEIVSLDPKVTETYNKVIPCILNNPSVQGLTAVNFKYPDDAEAHYQDLLNKTAKYRGHPTHYTKGFDGPWIENLWIEHFIDKPLSYFSGLIPIFAQFVDIHVHSFMRMGSINNAAFKVLHQQLAEDLKQLLRPDVLYIAISQDDEGISFGGLFENRPNVLVLSAGGFGHVPIPLVKGIFNYQPIDVTVPGSVVYKTGFYGAPQNGDHRQGLLKKIEGEFKQYGIPFNWAYEAGRGWEAKMATTLFNLAPRGFGRTSYRLAEIIQMGRIPIFLYSDVAWIPYQGSNISVYSIGFVGTGSLEVEAGQSMKRIAEAIATMNVTTMQDYINRVRLARDHYTLPGVIAQIDKFVQDPLGPSGGELRCVRVPNGVI